MTDWLEDYCADAESSDVLIKREAHVDLLAAGLIGEAGDVLAELKKRERDKTASDTARERIQEELGDLLWYFVRLIQVTTKRSPNLDSIPSEYESNSNEDPLYLGLMSSAIKATNTLRSGPSSVANEHTRDLWLRILALSSQEGLHLAQVAEANIAKRRSRWRRMGAPFHDLFDNDMESMEQLPRKITVDVLQHPQDEANVVLLRCNGINVGDRLTDNRHDKDYYRYHDVFHIANAVFLGWSPVLRSLLRCKRKSEAVIDENEDGGRARVIEEAIVALVFTHAKQRGMFDGIHQVEYSLLKTISQLVQGFEVDRVPLWQWEMAILAGADVFRKVKEWGSARLFLNLESRTLSCVRLPSDDR